MGARAAAASGAGAVRALCHDPRMRRVSVNQPPFDYDSADPEGFRSGIFRVGAQLGARETGASVYELWPGQAVCPYHYEYGEEAVSYTHLTLPTTPYV